MAIVKVTPNGKEILKNINLGMYLGAKIGVLGANGAGKSSLMRILAQEVRSAHTWHGNEQCSHLCLSFAWVSRSLFRPRKWVDLYTPPVMRVVSLSQDTNCEGRIQLSPGIKIGHLKQEPELNDGASKRGPSALQALHAPPFHF